MNTLRKEPEVTQGYKKDPEDERFLEKLNGILGRHQEEDYQGNLEEIYPTLHIIGAPRSGTTPLLQLLATHLDIGYINNLIASFWQAPVYGIRLSKKLIPPGVPSCFQSDFGRTRGMHEPHEFGYFWSLILGYKELLEPESGFEERIDWDRLRLILVNMTHAFGRPIIFKTFHLAWHVTRMQKVLPKTCFIRIRRDPLQNAASIFRMRKKFLGSAEKWASLKPAEYSWLKDEPYWRQVAGQVYYLEKSMTKQIREIGGHNILEVTYEDFCRNPKGILYQVKELLARNGNEVDLISEPPESFRMMLEDSYLEKGERDLISRAVREFYGT